LRYRVQVGLNQGEARHALVRAVFFTGRATSETGGFE
jgi:TnpA family transposase